MAKSLKPQRPFTGKHMVAVLVLGFGVVVAVNFTMAFVATSGFHGVVVENGYIASQKYNGWLAEAKAQERLGWSAEVRRDEQGRLAVATSGVPTGAEISAQIRRPLGDADAEVLALTSRDADRYLSHAALPAGRWIVRLTITANGDSWHSESEIA